MITEHNKLTKTSYWLLAINSVLGFIFIAGFFAAVDWDQPLFSYVIASVISIILLINTYFAYLIYKGSVKTLKLCMWLYGLQIFGFETENWSYSLKLGMAASVNLSFGETQVAINVLAVIIFVVVYLAYRSVTSANKSSQQDAIKPGASA